MIRLRVTDLDQWVRFLEPEIPEFEISLEQFIAQMRRLVPATEDMIAGQVFHSVLETASIGPIDEITRDGLIFSFECDYALEVPQHREASIEKLYPTPCGSVLLRGKIDGATDLSIIDYKLTTSTFDVERYADSLQWRAYLDMMGRQRFKYYVFQAKRAERGGKKGNHIRIVDVHPLTFWAYPAMHDDIARRVAELADFVTVHVPEMVIA